MSKHRKTRKQKIIADLRHKVYSFDPAQLGFDSKSVPSFQSNIPSEVKRELVLPVATNKYPYLLHDISKTGILTASIVFIQLILFFLLKKHILMLPIVTY